ncbi:hypothetical protein [Kordiimonas sp.]|uniref:hypothetical protein n=1 Tax=Kordiimonas sp. TaxID=1970157 RepID=UPI003A94CFA4
MSFAAVRVVAAVFLVFSSGGYTAANDDVELLNGTLIAKLHLDTRPDRAQMLGAYQVSFRNTGDAPLGRVSILLNPGLRVSKVLGPGGARLQTSDRNANVAGTTGLRLKVVDISFAVPLKPKSRLEIVIHYAGTLDDLSVMGLPQSREMLSPDFTMLRAEGFAYPVFAYPTMPGIEAAWQGKPFHQVAFVEVNGSQNIVGNLSFAEKTTTGTKTNFELKSTQPTGPLTLAIGDYDTNRSGGITVAFRTGQATEARSIAAALATYSESLNQSVGTPKSNAQLTIASVRDGYGSGRRQGLVYVEDSMFDAATLSEGRGIGAKLRAAVLDMWMLNPSRAAGHWANGIDRFIMAAQTSESDMPHIKKTLFDEVLTLEKRNRTLGKTPLTDFTTEGFEVEADAVSTLAFAVLHDLLGEEQFWALIRKLRGELSAGYTDTTTLADFLDRSLDNRAAKKFAANWFEKGRMGKDLAKAETFGELVSRYR